MNTRLTLAAATLAAATLLAACGVSSRPTGSSASGASTTPSSASASTSSAAATMSASSTTTVGTTTVGTTTTTAATTTRPPEVPRGRTRSIPHSRPVAPDTNVRLPVLFTIPAGGGRLIPPLVSAPKGVTIDLRVRNLDSRAHRVVLEAPDHYTAALDAGRTATTVVVGLPNATYRLLIDGSVWGRIVVGTAPGP